MLTDGRSSNEVQRPVGGMTGAFRCFSFFAARFSFSVLVGFFFDDDFGGDLSDIR
jgi:hypothetical protein